MALAVRSMLSSASAAGLQVQIAQRLLAADVINKVPFVTADCDLLASAAALHSENLPACSNPKNAS
jgi:hypothetical protein